MSNWSDDEKTLLLAALQKYGSGNFDAISKCIEDRKPAEVELYLLKLAKRARSERHNIDWKVSQNVLECHPLTEKRAPTGYKYNDCQTIDQSIDHLLKRTENVFDIERLAISKTLKVLSESEQTQKRSIRDAYRYVSEVIDGNIPPSLSEESSRVMHYALYKLINKILLKPSKERYLFLSSNATTSVNVPKKTYSRISHNNQEYIMLNSINPMNMPKKLLLK